MARSILILLNYVAAKTLLKMMPVEVKGKACRKICFEKAKEKLGFSEKIVTKACDLACEA